MSRHFLFEMIRMGWSPWDLLIGFLSLIVTSETRPGIALSSMPICRHSSSGLYRKELLILSFHSYRDWASKGEDLHFMTCGTAKDGGEKSGGDGQLRRRRTVWNEWFGGL